MAKLHTFGCSFTEDFTPFYNDTKLNHRTNYMHSFLGGRIPKSWTELLAEKLKLEFSINGAVNCDLKHSEKYGNTNLSIFLNFCRESENININDSVIIEWTFLERFLWYDKSINGFLSVLPNQYPTDELSNDFFDQLIYNKSNVKWYEEIKNYEKIIKQLAQAKGFKIFFWSIDERYYQYLQYESIIKDDYLLYDIIKNTNSILRIIKNRGGKTIEDETNGEIKDSHFGEIGHQVIADLFYKHISNE